MGVNGNSEIIEMWNQLLNNENMPQNTNSPKTGSYIPGTRLLNVPERGYIAWGQSKNNDSGCSPSYNQKVKKKWYQGWFADCPCGSPLLGCGAVAIGQVMWYWQWPQKYNWSQMPPRLTESSTSTEGNAVAELLLDCANAASMVFACNGSFTNGIISPIESALKNTFNYKGVGIFSRSDFSSSVWNDLIRTEIDCGRPLIMYGSKAWTIDKRHYFIIDGYHATIPNFFKINFGWRGNWEEGHFFLNNISRPKNEGDFNFSDNQKVVIGISPTYSGSDMEITVSDWPQEFPENSGLSMQVNNANSFDFSVKNSIGTTIYRRADVITGNDVELWSKSAFPTNIAQDYICTVRFRNNFGRIKEHTWTVSFAIFGPSSICITDDGYYSLDNTNFQPTWSVSGNLTLVTEPDETPAKVHPTNFDGQSGILTAKIGEMIVATKTIQTCSLSITRSTDFICGSNSATYEVQDLPSGLTVDWSKTGNFIDLVALTDNSVQVTRNSLQPLGIIESGEVIANIKTQPDGVPITSLTASVTIGSVPNPNDISTIYNGKCVPVDPCTFWDTITYKGFPIMNNPHGILSYWWHFSNTVSRASGTGPSYAYTPTTNMDTISIIPLDPFDPRDPREFYWGNMHLRAHFEDCSLPIASLQVELENACGSSGEVEINYRLRNCLAEENYQSCLTCADTIPNPDDCSSYFIITNGMIRSVQRWCPPNQYFDPVSRRCGLNIPVGCGMVLCPPYRDPLNCSRYYVNCNDQAESCPPGEYFCVEKRQCVAPGDPDCTPCNKWIKFTYFPNPTKERLTVEIIELRRADEDSFDADQEPIDLPELDISIKLYDNMGIVQRQARHKHRRRGNRDRDSDNSSVRFDTHNLREGTYFLHIEYEGEIEKHQIIVERK
ncbi:MAG: C10 family peptidase [Bacteroidales bacterium]|nr:C10 family peptidase [Bacteroidales bacterium]